MEARRQPPPASLRAAHSPKHTIASECLNQMLTLEQ